MPKNKIILAIGAFVALLHIFNGLPNRWESSLSIAAGLAIVILSVWSTIDKKLSLKAKAQQRQRKPEPIPQEGLPGVPYGKRVTDFYPKTGQPGRRVTDINSTPGPNQREL